MLTFSQLVDDVAAQTGRVDRVQAIALGLNQTVREVHANERGQSIHFPRNLVEDQLTATLEEAFSFTVPDFFQGMRTVRFDSVLDTEGDKVYPKLMRPGRLLRDKQVFYYRAGRQFFFTGYGGLNALISIAYYQFPRMLKYKAVGSRPAEYDLDTGWTYFDLTAAGDLDYRITANQPLAEALVTNWLIFDWFQVLVEGTKNKAYKAIGDNDRARTHFAQYNVGRTSLITGEDGESLEM